jgi:uncharacterized membrane-anchored protein YhcB (DUF1043 family)
MDNFWYGAIVGIFVGTNIGALIVAMCVAAKSEDNRKQKILNPDKDISDLVNGKDKK